MADPSPVSHAISEPPPAQLPRTLLSILLSATLAAASATACAHAEREVSLSVPVTDAVGQTVQLAARLCRPASDTPAPLVVIAHGSPPSAADRPTMRLSSCSSEAAQWFLHRGYAVMFALRRGYGETGGEWAENYGRCAQANYVDAGRETARDINAQVEYATRLPYIRPDNVTVLGLSAGGWGTIAYDSLPHPKVSHFIVMAAGRGGHEYNRPNENCQPDRLAAATGEYGKTASTPMLWIYAENDSFFGPSLADAMYAAFTRNGGQATYIHAPAFRNDGHRLFFGKGGSAIWGPPIARYLGID